MSNTETAFGRSFCFRINNGDEAGHISLGNPSDGGELS
jgi:hypothetical protein